MAGVVRTAVDLLAAGAGARGLVPGAPPRDRQRWSNAQAQAWRDEVGWLVGCNFVPSTASNQLEMWQPATYDPAVIDRELGWAAGIGMNCARVFLHDLLWEVEGDRFLDRVDEVLAVAARHRISVVPVFFDGIWDPEPRPGPQRPRPGIHNSTWVQGPGAAVVADRSRWPALRPYVDAVLDRFGQDRRVVAWDLFNEPDSPNPAYLRRDPPAKRRLVGELLEDVWDWAVAADPVQPLTVGAYVGPDRPHPERASAVARTALERSDVVSFHCYAPEARLRRAIEVLGATGRPLVCTEWMARPGSPVELLSVFHELGVGCLAWGLVDGRSQTRYRWTSWVRQDPPDTPWFHDLLHGDGTSYDQAEVDRFRRLAADPPTGSPPLPRPAPAVDVRLRPIVALGRRVNRHDPTLSMPEQRAAAEAQTRRGRSLVMPDGPACRERDVRVPVDGDSITVRLYEPPTEADRRPLHVFIHGGGWCKGTLFEREPRCREIAVGADCVVASVEYRLAPEHPFPVPLDDCDRALHWLVDHADDLGLLPDVVSVGGESSGANLAAVLARRARDRSGPRIVHQWLDVPAVDLTLSSPSVTEVPDGFQLDRATIDQFLSCYLPDPALALDPDASPLFAASLADLPPAWIMGCEVDKLRDDATRYAEALTAAGVPVHVEILPGVFHAAFAFTRILPSARDYERRAIAALAAAQRATRR